MAVCKVPDTVTVRARILREKDKKKKRRKRKRQASNMNATAPQTGDQVEPDSDAIKMFVGQIPRSMDENDLRKMFEEFGPVFQLNVLRDKVTGQSKGCCFITFYTRKAALDAQNELHNIKTMAGMQHPIQMKPADSEKRNEERKLFIGMLSRKTTEQDVRMMFGAFGQIEECTILREQSGESKGCAFITFCNKQCALNSIKATHHSQTMEGCRHPLVVKFADTQKEKEIKKVQQVNANILSSLGALGGLNALTPQYMSLIQQAGGNQGMGGASLGNLGGLNALQLQQVLTAAASAAAALQNNPALSATLATLSSMNNVSAPVTNGQTNSQNPSISNAGLSGNLNPGNLAALQQILAAATQQQPGGQGMQPMHNPGTSSPNSNSAPMGVSASMPTNGGMASAYGQNSLGGATGGMQSLGGATNGIGGGQGNHQGNAMETINQAYTGIQQYAASFPNAFNTQSPAQQLQQQANTPAGKQTEGIVQTQGPDGANLFIYHLPQEFADHDLLQMFMPFGTVVSAKVFIDKQTNLSKCFGFVSYDNPVSAQAAIQAMNGFQIGMKRLKVQLKRPKSDAKPY